MAELFQPLTPYLSFEICTTLVLGAFLAGLVRGFSGFGTAMVFLPFAGQVLSPGIAIVCMAAMDIVGPIPAIIQSRRDGDFRQIGRLSLGLLLGMPIGLLMLSLIDPELFRYIVSAVSLMLLALLLGGFRLKKPPGSGPQYAAGLTGGVLGGLAGIPGPPIVLLYMASPCSPALIRANSMAFLLIADLAIFVSFGYMGVPLLAPVLIGFGLVLPYMIAVMIGSWIFKPEKARFYRIAGYAIIAGSAIGGLPLWSLI